MNWLAASILATLIASGGQLLMAEVFTRAIRRHGDYLYDTQVHKYRRQLWLATVIVWAVFALWFWLDFMAIAAGRRSFAVTIANCLSFIVLFFSFTVRIMASFRPDRSESHLLAKTAYPTSSQKPLVEYLSPIGLRATYVFVAVSLLFGLTALLTSKNDIGYRIKGMLLFFAGAAFFYLWLRRLHQPSSNRVDFFGEQPAITGDRYSGPHRRALQSFVTAVLFFCVFELASILTLTLDWHNPWQSWLGVGSQLAASILGFIGCAKILAEERDN